MRLLSRFARLRRDAGWLLPVFRVLASGKAPTTLPFALGGGTRPIDKEASPYLLRQPGYREMLATRWRPPRLTLEELRSRPPGSLAQELADYCTQRNLKPEALWVEPRTMTDGDYFLCRYRETHDILHLLTRLDSSWLGELGLQAFYYAQLRSRKSALYAFGGMLHGVDADDGRQERIVEIIAQGLSIGMKAQCVFACKLEEYLDESIEEVRRQLAIEPLQARTSR